MSDTNRERLMFTCYSVRIGYELGSFEIAAHRCATDSRKESRCLSCHPIQLSKNRLPSKRAARLPDPLRPCQAECFRSPRGAWEPFRLTRTSVTRVFSGAEKIELLRGLPRS